MSQPSFFCFLWGTPILATSRLDDTGDDLEKCMGLGLGSVYSEVWSGVKGYATCLYALDRTMKNIFVVQGFVCFP